MFPKTEGINDNTEMIRSIKYPIDGQNVIVLGHPGTGKTVVAINRYVELLKKGKNVLFLCYNKLLRNYIVDIIKNNYNITFNNENIPIKTIDGFYWYINNELGIKLEDKYLKNFNINDINNLFNNFLHKKLINKYDEIIIDEGQDISLEILKNLENISNHIIILMDDLQIIKNNFNDHTIINPEELEENDKYELIQLTKNYRNPKNIFDFAKEEFVKNKEKLLPTDSLKLKSGKLEIKRDLSEEEILDNVIEKINEYKSNNIAIFLYSQNKVKTYFNTINNFKDFKNIVGYYTSEYNKNNYKNNNSYIDKKIFITTYNSAKGLEFDNVIVIIDPNEIKNINININEILFVLTTRSLQNIFYFFKK